MDAIALTTIIVYLVAATTAGSLMARRARNSAGWAVAGGGMSTMLVAVGIAGTRIGGAGTYGVAGDVISGGVWNLWWYGINAFLALAIVGLFFAIYFRRFRLHTVGELFTIRFGNRRCQWLTSLCVQTEYAIVNLIEAYVIGVSLSTLTPLPMLGGVLVAGAIFATYVSLGGLWGTAVTNLIHCSVVLVGLTSVGLMGINELGGWTAVTTTVDAHLAAASRDTADWWGFIGTGWLPVFGMFFAAAVHTPAASVYTNYSTAARSERHIAPAFLLGGLIAAAMPMLAGLIGILTTAKYGLDTGLGGYRNLTTLASEISPVVGGIALLSGVLILVGSVAMTKFQRRYETAIFKTLGATTRTIVLMLVFEYGLLGTLAGLVGSVGALALTWGLTEFLLEISWTPAPLVNLAGLGLTALIVASVGVTASLDVLRQKPMATLRAE